MEHRLGSCLGQSWESCWVIQLVLSLVPHWGLCWGSCWVRQLDCHWELHWERCWERSLGLQWVPHLGWSLGLRLDQSWDCQ